VQTVTTKFVSLPSQPQNLALIVRTGGAATLQWEPPVDFGGTNVTNYQIAFFVGYGVQIQYQQLVTNVSFAATTISARVSKLLANTTYGFLVIALNEITACADAASFLSYPTVFTTTLPTTPPETPLNLEVVTSTSGMQVVTWSPPIDSGGEPILSYLLYSYSDELLYRGTGTEFKRGALSPNQTYGYYLLASNSAGTSQRSALVYRKTAATSSVPGAPTALSIVGVSGAAGGSIRITWTPPMDTGGDNSSLRYQVYRNDVALLPVDQLIASTTFLDEGLSASTQYSYVVRAANAIGFSAVSERLLALTSSVPTSPNAPTDVTAIAVGGGRLNVTWRAPVDTGGVPLLQFRVSVFLLSAMQTPIQQTSTTIPQFAFTSAQANTTYVVSVVAVNVVGAGAIATVQVRTGPPSRSSPPPPPIAVIVSAQAVTLSLSPPAETGGASVSSYKIYRNGVHVANVSASGSIQTEIHGLAAMTQYNFSVSVMTVAGVAESDRSSSLFLQTTQPIPPSVVYNFAVMQRHPYSLILGWEGPDQTGGDAIVFEIEYADMTTVVVVKASASASPFALESLMPSTNYTIRLRATNSAGSSPWAGPVNVQTDVNQRGAVTFKPTNVTVLETATSLLVTLVRENGTASTITCLYNVSTTKPALAIASVTMAVEDVDFALDVVSARSFTFGDGETEKEFEIRFIDNALYNPQLRLVALTLFDVTDRTDAVEPQTATVYIEDDGDAGLISFEKDAISVNESAGVLAVPLVRVNGMSSATVVRVSVDDKAPGTAVLGSAFFLETTDVTFGDGVVREVLKVVIQDDVQYDFPFKFFKLKLRVVGGGAGLGEVSEVTVTIEDNGDHSPPGHVAELSVARATGGMLVIQWSPPVNVGGNDVWIAHYSVTMIAPPRPGSADKPTSKTFVRSTNDTSFAIGALEPLTKYSFSVAAANVEGLGPDSPTYEATTTNVTRPGAPTNVMLDSATGGMLRLLVDDPMDTGGAPVTGFVVSMFDDESGNYNVRHAV
jgi:hypothetical protein